MVLKPGTHLHAVAYAMGAQATGDTIPCGVCVQSPFAVHGTLRSLGNMFNGWELLRSQDANQICAGCKVVLGGRPGSSPPPLRTMSVRVMLSAPVLEIMSNEDWWPLLQSPPGEAQVVSRAISRKKHHIQFAGISVGETWRIGMDNAAATWSHSPELLHATLSLWRLGANRIEIVTGRYSHGLLARQPKAVMEHDKTARRWRGPALDVVAFALPQDEKPKRKSKEVLPMPLSQTDQISVHLLAKLAWGSNYRVENGLQFWDGYFLNRIVRFSRLELPDFVSRTAGELGVRVSDMSKIGNMIDTMNEDTQAAVSKALQERPELLHGLAFGKMEEYREERKKYVV